ncbi:tryptophan 7-halogenase [Microbulbifer rhizosphaerae]|uniref:Tryptophan halogenase n=1 Tax=Microbulbifer rhizosphaerae TaxID=1562603 RepID=A0A7W4ZA89_9GAMM|nr:hypothetical protein [Microbulbifer rhizosphaerae]
MANTAIQNITIVGGGTAGWMAAAVLVHHYREHPLRIQLVESEQIGTVGVGEATVPGVIRLNQYLGIKESDFIAATGATFKLGIEFADWYKPGESFFHPFADFGAPVGKLPFFPCWLKLHKLGRAAPLEDYCLSAAMSEDGRLLVYEQESFSEASWLAIYNGLHFRPRRYLSDVDQLDTEQLAQLLEKMRRAVALGSEHAPRHEEFLAQLATD